MGTPSRQMQPAPERRASIMAWPVLGAIVAGVVWLAYLHPWIIIAIALIVIASIVGGFLHRRAMRRLSSARDGEGICEFSRSFERHQVDTWILRAVYEELSKFFQDNGYGLPLRADDRLEEDFTMDSDDLDDIVADIAYRARRSLDDTEKNPFYGKIKSVRDLVNFLEHQPKLG